MSKSRDSVDAIAEAIREDDEAREALAEAVVEQMDVDGSMPEAKGAQAHRRDVLKTLGLLGTGAAAGALGGTAATREARAADTSVGQVGTSGNPVDIALDQIKDDGGDVVADIDDTGDVDFKRGIASPAVTTPTIVDADDGTAYDVGSDLAGGGGGGGGAYSYTAIAPGDPLADIETPLSNGGTVVLQAGDHAISDRIDITSNNATLIIESGASIKIGDGATPTAKTDTKANDYYPVIHADGYDDVTVVNHGTINANDTNHNRGLGVYIGNGADCRVDSPGRIVDAHDGVYIVDCDDSVVNRVRSRDCTQAVLAAEGTVGLSVGRAFGQGADEVVDLNGVCTETTVNEVLGEAIVSYVMEIGESPETTVHSIKGTDNCTSLLRIEADHGVHFTSKAAIGHADDVTVKSIQGTTTHPAIVGTGASPLRNLTLEGVNVASTGNHGVHLKAETPNQYDGLVAKGYAESQAGAFPDRGWYFNGDGNQQDGARVNVASDGSGDGVYFLEWRNVTGTVHATGNEKGLAVNTNGGGDADNFVLDVRTLNNSDSGIDLLAGAAADWKLRGVSFGNGEDITINGGSDVHLDMHYGTITINAGAVSNAQYA